MGQTLLQKWLGALLLSAKSLSGDPKDLWLQLL